MSAKITILVVDDDFSASVLEDIARATGVTIRLARTERAAGEFLTSEVAKLQLILMDGYLEPNRDKPRDTEDLVRWIRRKGYTGLMIAISNDEKISQKLVVAGCDGLWLKGEVVPRLKLWIADRAAQ